MARQIQLRRDTAANFTSADPTPAQGEPCFETDTNKLKIGDGSTAWTSLAYFEGEQDTMQTVFDRGQTITIADTDNQSLTITQNDTTNNPAALIIANTGSGNDITAPNFSLKNWTATATTFTDWTLTITGGDISSVGTITNTNAISTTIADTTNAVALTLTNNDTTNNPDTLVINNTTTGRWLEINQTWNWIALAIDHDWTERAVDIQSDWANINIFNIIDAGDGTWLRIQATAQHTTRELVELRMDDTSSTTNCVEIANNGTWDSIFINHNNEGNVLEIDGDANSANDIVGIVIDIANSGAGGNFAFEFTGSELDATAWGSTQTQRVSVKTAAGTRYLYLYSD